MGLLTFGTNVTLDGCCDHTLGILVVHPVLAGRGPRLFDGLAESRQLERVSVKSFQGGQVALHLRRRKGERASDASIVVLDDVEIGRGCP